MISPRIASKGDAYVTRYLPVKHPEIWNLDKDEGPPCAFCKHSVHESASRDLNNDTLEATAVA